MAGLGNVSVLIATPCHDGRLTEGCVRSLMELSHILRDHGASMELVTPGGESLITRARNGLTGYFIAKPEFSHLLFVDSDIHFKPAAVIRMLTSGHDVVGGCYPLKEYPIGKLREAVQRYEEPADVWANSCTYAFTANTNDDGDIELSVEDGFCRVRDVATGLMLISRSCIDQMRLAYPELHCGEKTSCCNYDHIHPEINSNFWLFFETSYDADAKRYLSEDYHFCKLWRDLGEEVWMEVASPIVHTGIGHYRGDIRRTFEYKETDDES